MNIQKGSATVVMLVVLVVVLVAVLVYFAFLKKPGEVAVSPTPTAETANRKIYTNTEYGFQLTLTNAWQGYTTKKDSGGIEFLVPSTQPSYQKNISVFFINVAPITEWQNKNSDEQRDLIGTYLGKNQMYVFGYDRAQDDYGMPNGVWDSVPEVVKSFKLR